MSKHMDQILEHFGAVEPEDILALEEEIRRQRDWLEGLIGLRDILNMLVKETPRPKHPLFCRPEVLPPKVKVKKEEPRIPPEGPSSMASLLAEERIPPKTNNTLELRRRKVLEYLFKTGPRTMENISEDNLISRHGPNCLAMVLSHPWFLIGNGQRVSLTTEGHQTVKVPIEEDEQ